MPTCRRRRATRRSSLPIKRRRSGCSTERKGDGRRRDGHRAASRGSRDGGGCYGRGSSSGRENVGTGWKRARSRPSRRTGGTVWFRCSFVDLQIEAGKGHVRAPPHAGTPSACRTPRSSSRSSPTRPSATTAARSSPTTSGFTGLASHVCPHYEGAFMSIVRRRDFLRVALATSGGVALGCGPDRRPSIPPFTGPLPRPRRPPSPSSPPPRRLRRPPRSSPPTPRAPGSPTACRAATSPPTAR